MPNIFSPQISKILDKSRHEATRLQSRCVNPEHILLSMLSEKSTHTSNIFRNKNLNLEQIKHQIETLVQEDGIFEHVNMANVVLSEHANNILRMAIAEAKAQNSVFVTDVHLLMAMLKDSQQSNVRSILEQNDVNYDEIQAYAQEQAGKTQVRIEIRNMDDDEDESDLLFLSPNAEGKSGAGTKTKKQAESSTPLLDHFSVDLTAAAAEGKLDPVVGRNHEIERITEILCRRKKNNPVLIGEPGVGKSAIVEGLAQLIHEKKTSPILFNKRLLNLDMSLIVAGTKYRGQFEERLKAIINELENNPDIIVFIDEIHTMIGAGSTSGSMDAANMMKPALARGQIQCIGATTLDEYRNSIEKDGALERRFQKVMVEQTTAEETIEILTNIAPRYEEHHHVHYTDEAIKACVTYSDRYISDRQFPDKAIDVMDEVGAKVHLRNTNVPPIIAELQEQLKTADAKKKMAVSNQNFELAAAYRDRQVQLEKQLAAEQKAFENGTSGSVEDVTESDVAEAVSLISGVPVQRVAESEGARLREMSETLRKKVIAQDRAITKVVKAIQRNRVGLKDPNHPIGAFMFLGPTGVGKTHLAKQLAIEMFGSSDALIRIDMSEYTESFNTSRLIGAPPGYIGYEEGGQLTERVRRHPYSIVLLDEIEKAHHNVFNMLLQVLDEGRLTDGNGRLIDFRNTIIIMTSNAGTRQLKEFGRGIGFSSASAMGISASESDKEYARSIIQKSLQKQFAPEFLNRIDEIITFDQLDIEAIKSIIDIELKQLFSRVEALGFHLQITDDAKTFVAEKGYDVQYGARPLKRAIQTYIEDAVCELLLSDSLTADSTLVAELVEDDIKVTIQQPEV